MILRIRKLVEGKKVQICTHWDADGVASGALVYHLIKDYAGEITTKTKGKPFLIEQSDICNDVDVVICTDIHSAELKKQVVYIDHHPVSGKNFDIMVNDEDARSTTLVIFNSIMDNSSKKDPYLIFLVVLGYLGDGGDVEDMPPELKSLAYKLLEGLMSKNESSYSERGYYYEISKYVSLLNTGKRVLWSGDIPLELLKNIDSPEPLVCFIHPLAQQLFQYKQQLREAYDGRFEIRTVNGLDYCLMSNNKNIQGVLAARYMDDKPILVMNSYNGEVIGSMRVPDFVNVNAGSFLDNFNGMIPTFTGGGHEKAAGFTMDEKYLQAFLECIRAGQFSVKSKG